MFNFEYTCFRSTIPRTRPRLGSVFLRPMQETVSLVPRGQIATCQNSLILSLSLSLSCFSRFVWNSVSRITWMIRDNSSWPTMRKDDPAGSVEGVAVWKESGRKSEGGTERGRKRNKICIGKIFSSGSVPSRILRPVSPPPPVPWQEVGLALRPATPSAYDVMTVLDIPWTKGGKSIGRKPAPLPRRRLCFVSRRLVCFARAIEPAQNLPTRPSPYCAQPIHRLLSSLSFLYCVLAGCVFG